MSNKNNKQKRASFLGPYNSLLDEPQPTINSVMEDILVETKPAEKFVSVKIKKLNLRHLASKDSSVVRELTQGTKLVVLDQIREWTKVRTIDTLTPIIGYVMSEFVEEV